MKASGAYEDVLGNLLQWVGGYSKSSCRFVAAESPRTTADGQSIYSVFPLRTKKRLFKFVLSSLQCIIQSQTKIFNNNYYSPFYLTDLIGICYGKLLDDEVFPKHILMKWYANIIPAGILQFMKERGSDLIFCCDTGNFIPPTDGSMIGYSLFCTTNKDIDPKPAMADFWVIDENTKHHLSMAIGEAAHNIDVKGYIAFGCMGFPAEIKTEGCSVVVFDVLPHNDLWQKNRGYEGYYYQEETMVEFLEDIANLAIKYDFKIYFKRKRKVESWREKKFASARYLNLLSNLDGKGTIIFLPPDTSISSILDNVNYAISIPFTSSQRLVEQLGKKGCYYDPTKIIPQNHPACGNSLLVSGVDKLEELINTYVTSH